MVLVDSSVWIDFLKKGDSKEGLALAQLIQEEEDLATCGQIRQEVLQGIRDEGTFRQVRELMDQVQYLSLEEPALFDKAVEIYRSLRRQGKTLRSPADCLIAAIALRYDLPLLHHDRDFTTIGEVCRLRIYDV